MRTFKQAAEELGRDPKELIDFLSEGGVPDLFGATPDWQIWQSEFNDCRKHFTERKQSG
jgi:hypothetical protein